MTTLTVQAIITAVDNLTGPLRAMAGNLTGIQAAMQKTGAVATNLGVTTAAAMAAPLTAMATFAVAGQEELDRALRGFQVVGTATDQQRKQLRDLVMDVGPRLGMPQLELIKGAQDLVQAGLLPEDLMAKGADGVTMLERIAGGAKVAGDKIEGLAIDLVTLARSFNLPWGNAQEKLETLNRLMGLALVAPRLSPDTPKMHTRALAEFGAIAAQLGLQPEEASALQNVLSQSGFPGSRGGMAMKTILQRLLNPTPAAQQQMSLAGFNYGRVMRTDLSGMSADDVIKALGIVGIDASAGRALLAERIKAGAGNDLLAWKANLSTDLADELGFGKKDVRERGFIKRALDNVVAARAGGMNMIAFLEELSKMDVGSFKDFAGLHHASKAAVLKFRQALVSYKEFLETTKAQAPTALQEGLSKRTAGWAYALDRARAALTSFKSALWEAGAGDAWTWGIMRVGDALVGLSRIDPGALKAIGGAMSVIGAGAAGLAGLGIGLQGAAFALGGLALAGQRLAAIPFWGKAIAAGGLAALLIGANSGAFAGVTDSINGESFMGPGARALSELGALLATISSKADEATGNLAKLLGLDASGSTLGAALGFIADRLKDLNTLLNKEGASGFLIMRSGSALSAPPTNISALSAPPANGGMLERLRQWWQSPGLGNPSDSGLGLAGQPVARLEGAGVVTVNVKVDGPGNVSGLSVSDDGRHIRMKAGTSMPDTGTPVD